VLTKLPFRRISAAERPYLVADADARTATTMPGKRVQFDDETWHALDLLARDTMKDFQELADEAFRDLLRKHDRPTDLKSALRRSAGSSATVVALHPKRRTARRRRA
jgi:hypothetical protein